MYKKNKSLSGAAARTGELNKKYYKNIQKRKAFKVPCKLA